MLKSNVSKLTVLTSACLLLASCNSTLTSTATDVPKLGTQRLLCDPNDPSSCTGGPSGGGPTTPTPLGGQDRSIEVYLNSLLAIQTTDDGSGTAGIGNTRDEVFMEVVADTPYGQYGVRLPRRDDQGDYYGFNTNQSAVASDPSTWTDRDSAYMGRPMVYSGPLADGQSVKFVVTLLEQDNTTLGSIRTAVTTALASLTGPVGATKNVAAIAALAGVQGLATLIPNVNAGDVIGGYALTISNTGGVLTRTWLPLTSIVTSKGTATTALNTGSPFAISNTTATKDTQTFSMAATGNGSYLATASVETVSDTQAAADRPLSYLGEQNDACGSDNLVVDGRVRVGKNQTAGMDVSMSGGDHWYNSGQYFHWTCDGTAEQTGPDSATNYLIASHHGGYGDRNIHWYTFKKVNQ